MDMISDKKMVPTTPTHLPEPDPSWWRRRWKAISDTLEKKVLLGLFTLLSAWGAHQMVGYTHVTLEGQVLRSEWTDHGLAQVKITIAGVQREVMTANDGTFFLRFKVPRKQESIVVYAQRMGFAIRPKRIYLPRKRLFELEEPTKFFAEAL